TGASILSIVERDEGMIEPTMRGCSTNPRKNTPAGPSACDTRRISLKPRRSAAISLPFMVRNAPLSLRELVGRARGQGLRLANKARYCKQVRQCRGVSCQGWCFELVAARLQW